MSNYLFDEFQGVTPAEWKQKIQVDLKGADYNETLLWKTREGISVKPFYTKEDRNNSNVNTSNKGFAICQSIHIEDEEKANLVAIDALQRGASALKFIATKEFDYKKLLNEIAIQNTTCYFSFEFLSSEFITELAHFINSENCYFNIDIIGHLASSGNWYANLKNDHTQLEEITKATENAITVNASIYQNAGATIVQQLAYALAHANEYLNHFGSAMAKNIHFNFSVGSNYFFEIAKLRAFRILWDALLKEYHTEATAHIFVQPSLRNKTLYDYNVNMLRTTSECMSAVLGGANTIANSAYDTIFHRPNEFGERIARNQLLILQQESELAEAQNIADGAYYIETITQQLAQKALEVFKLIEKGGGFLKQLKEGIIQQKIKESADKEQQLFDTGELVLLGTNKIQNENDQMKNDIEVSPFLKSRNEKTLIQPIIQKRLAEKLEQERLQNE
ncbi:methylmalonyl-CoA mutase subunit beta [Tenacibaculum tangerinum]|uniref:Methylmalonyl-CoA mutase subunit beta n=1 Tax=Tenacibaculum tangerinum TaxID=3038772 RepID=A0ABY8L9X0_9FLAO|nr:methylmalonyl-CoA mutase subunit beta [Tenacibaculum tangerinum]WGH76948.1 methylmalonyl-CoA mutase subunit beta [Tenacibaculum tangerinum]